MRPRRRADARRTASWAAASARLCHCSVSCSDTNRSVHFRCAALAAPSGVCRGEARITIDCRLETLRGAGRRLLGVVREIRAPDEIELVGQRIDLLLTEEPLAVHRRDLHTHGIDDVLDERVILQGASSLLGTWMFSPHTGTPSLTRTSWRLRCMPAPLEYRIPVRTYSTPRACPMRCGSLSR